jgi:NitT/TauT family transport system substrate-binding protein
MNNPGDDQLGRRRLIGAGIAGGVALGVAGSLVVRNQIRHPHKNKRAAPDGKPRQLVLAAPNPMRDPVLLAAHDQGVFTRYSLDIQFAPRIATAQSALDQVESGRADGAVVPALSWLPRLQAGLQARLVCGLQAGSSRLLIARRSPLHRIEDLHRRAIGIANPDGPDRLFFSIMMRRKGMNPNLDVEWRSIPAEALGLALTEGHIQAIAGHDPVIWQLRESLHFGELASSMSGSYGARVSRVLGLRNRLLDEDPKAAVAITLAMQEAAAWAAGHPQEVSVLLAAQDPDLTVEQVGRMLKSEGNAVHPTGQNLRNQIAQYVDEMKLIGLTPEDIDSATFAKHVTADVLKG